MKKRPSGVITSIASPGCSDSLAQIEKRPPGTFFTATRSSPSSHPEQTEYERRSSSPPSVARSARCWPCVKRYSSASASGSSNFRLTHSGVSRRTSATRSGWNRGVIGSRLEVFEGLAAGAAAVQRLARGRAELRQALGVGAAAARAGHARHERQGLRAARRPLARRRDAVGAQPLARVLGDPVGAPRGRQLLAHADVARPGGRQRFADRALDHLGRRAAGVGRRHDDVDAFVRRLHIPHDAELGHGDRRDLRVRHAREDVPGLGGRQHHQVPPG